MRPDFAHTDVSRLTDRDLQFLLEQFPDPGRSYEEIARVMDELPTTLESMLDSRGVVERVIEDRERLLRISPFLLFNVLLRQVFHTEKDTVQRRVINYLANLLAVFVDAHRLYRVEASDPRAYEYLVDLLEEAARADDRRRFLVHAHVGNFSLYLSGIFGRWIEERHQHGRRPVDLGYFSDLGSSSFGQASAMPQAEEYGLTDVFLRLALMFDPHREALQTLADEFLGTD